MKKYAVRIWDLGSCEDLCLIEMSREFFSNRDLRTLVSAMFDYCDAPNKIVMADVYRNMTIERLGVSHYRGDIHVTMISNRYFKRSEVNVYVNNEFLRTMPIERGVNHG